MFSYFEPNFIEKNPLGKVFFFFFFFFCFVLFFCFVFCLFVCLFVCLFFSNIWPPFWNGTTYLFFFFFFPELWIFIVHTYMVQISLQNSGGKVVFLGASMEPLGHQREWKYIGHLSIKPCLYFDSNALSPPEKGNSRLTKLLGRLNYENIRRYNNSPPYVTARW